MRRARSGDAGAFAEDSGVHAGHAGSAPGKRTRTEALGMPASDAAATSTAATATATAPARPSAFAAAPADGVAADLSYDALFGVSAGQMFGNAGSAAKPTEDNGTGKGKGKHKGTDAVDSAAAKTAPLTAADFADIDVPWNIAEKLVVAPVGNAIDLHVGQINNYGAAELKDGVDPARAAGYTLGFVQTLRSTNRVSIYSEDDARDAAYDKRHDTIHDEHARSQGKGKLHGDHEEPGADAIEAGHKKHKAKAPEYQRLVLEGGPLLDTLRGPSPWYDGSQNIAIGGDEAMITDHPRVTSPRKTPDRAATLSRAEGKDSFLTNFIAMPPGGGAPIYLAYATWAISYNGEFDRALSHFHGGTVTVSAEGKGKGGSPVLTGTPANAAIGNSATWSDPKTK
jgi:hypothetical protein